MVVGGQEATTNPRPRSRTKYPSSPAPEFFTLLFRHISLHLRVLEGSDPVGEYCYIRAPTSDLRSPTPICISDFYPFHMTTYALAYVLHCPLIIHHLHQCYHR